MCKSVGGKKDWEMTRKKGRVTEKTDGDRDGEAQKVTDRYPGEKDVMDGRVTTSEKVPLFLEKKITSGVNSSPLHVAFQ